MIYNSSTLFRTHLLENAKVWEEVCLPWLTRLCLCGWRPKPEQRGLFPGQDRASPLLTRCFSTSGLGRKEAPKVTTGNYLVTQWLYQHGHNHGRNLSVLDFYVFSSVPHKVWPHLVPALMKTEWGQTHTHQNQTDCVKLLLRNYYYYFIIIDIILALLTEGGWSYN